MWSANQRLRTGAGRGNALCDMICGAGRGQVVKQEMSRREGSSVPGLGFQTSRGQAGGELSWMVASLAL